MMELFNAFGEFLNAYAFPIVMCVYMVYHNEQESKRHKDEVDNLSKVISDNTLVMTKLVDKLDTLFAGGEH